ncbi:MAG: SCO family protein [Candidatus Dormibacteraeota bacterium]|nr:SCO family protein [Candidatus Dormibacteraeota bacterium]
MSSLRLTQRQWRIYLTVWLVVLAAVTGTLICVTVPRLLAGHPSPSLTGGIVLKANSVPAPGFTLRDQRGATVSLSDLRGRVIALTFLDTQCLNLCPLQASLLGTVQKDLGSGTPFAVVVVSVHPEVDTPATIATFAGAHGLGSHFYWLVGARSDLAGVWNSYGIAVLAASGDLAHSSVIYLIDKRGYERVGFIDVPQSAWIENDARILAQT